MPKSEISLHTHILQEKHKQYAVLSVRVCQRQIRRGGRVATETRVECISNRTSHLVHLEFMEVGAAFLSRGSHDVQEVWRENEGNPLLTDSHETLIIPQDVAKVDVEEVS